MEMWINKNNLIGWLELTNKVVDLPHRISSKIDKYIKRTDIVRRRKEIEDIIGDDEWLILQCVAETTAREE